MMMAGCLGMFDVDQMALGSDLRCVYRSKNAVMSELVHGYSEHVDQELWWYGCWLADLFQDVHEFT